jgi:hypothetical protein
VVDLPVQSTQLLQFLQFLQLVLLPDSMTDDWLQPIVMTICCNAVARSVIDYWFVFALQQTGAARRDVEVNRRQGRSHKIFVCCLTGA